MANTRKILVVGDPVSGNTELLNRIVCHPDIPEYQKDFYKIKASAVNITPANAISELKECIDDSIISLRFIFCINPLDIITGQMETIERVMEYFSRGKLKAAQEYWLYVGNINVLSQSGLKTQTISIIKGKLERFSSKLNSPEIIVSDCNNDALRIFVNKTVTSLGVKPPYVEVAESKVESTSSKLTET